MLGTSDVSYREQLTRCDSERERWGREMDTSLELVRFSPWGEFCFIFMDLFAEFPAHWGSSPRSCRTLITGVSSVLPTSRPDAYLVSRIIGAGAGSCNLQAAPKPAWILCEMPAPRRTSARQGLQQVPAGKRFQANHGRAFEFFM